MLVAYPIFRLLLGTSNVSGVTIDRHWNCRHHTGPTLRGCGSSL
jgi:hypothetical protein